MNEDLKKLRRKIDGDERFMSAHQIKKVRRRSEKVIPIWAVNDEMFKRVLLSSFPNLATNPLQRQRAARWVRVVHLYYKMGLPHGHVAKEMEVGYNSLCTLLRNIRRAANGMRADGTGVRKNIMP